MKVWCWRHKKWCLLYYVLQPRYLVHVMITTKSTIMKDKFFIDVYIYFSYNDWNTFLKLIFVGRMYDRNRERGFSRKEYVLKLHSLWPGLVWLPKVKAWRGKEHMLKKNV